MVALGAHAEARDRKLCASVHALTARYCPMVRTTLPAGHVLFDDSLSCWLTISSYLGSVISGPRPSVMPICRAKQTSSALGLPDLVNFVSELQALKVDLFLKTQGIGTTSPSGKAGISGLSRQAEEFLATG